MIDAIEAVAERLPDWSPLNHFAEVANNKQLDPVIRIRIKLDALRLRMNVWCRSRVQALVDLAGRITAAHLLATAHDMVKTRVLPNVWSAQQHGRKLSSSPEYLAPLTSRSLKVLPIDLSEPPLHQSAASLSLKLSSQSIQ